MNCPNCPSKNQMIESRNGKNFWCLFCGCMVTPPRELWPSCHVCGKNMAGACTNPECKATTNPVLVEYAVPVCPRCRHGNTNLSYGTGWIEAACRDCGYRARGRDVEQFFKTVLIEEDIKELTRRESQLLHELDDPGLTDTNERLRLLSEALECRVQINKIKKSKQEGGENTSETIPAGRVESNASPNQGPGAVSVAEAAPVEDADAALRKKVGELWVAWVAYSSLPPGHDREVQFAAHVVRELKAEIAP